MKKLILILTLVVTIFAGCAGMETKITKERAKEIALDNAGLTEADVKFVRIDKDRDDMRTVYEIEFHTKDRVEYEYEIDADTGDILSYDSEGPEQIPFVDKSPEETSSQSKYITEEEAKKIALEKVPGATEADIRGFRKDFDDGREEYEGKIIYDKAEYEFEIDANTGEFIKWESGRLGD